MGYPADSFIERRRRFIRIGLFVIILGTLPFYCAGFVLLGTARPVTSVAGTPTVTFTPIGGDAVATVTLPFGPTLNLTTTPLNPLRPTPIQFVPLPTRPFIPTAIVLPTTVFIPTSTLAPTLTPFPTSIPPTNTPLPTETPTPTWTPLPTDPPLPTETPLPTDPPPTDPPPEPPPAEPPPGV